MHRNGRPPLDPHDPSASVHVRLSGSEYDRLYAVAQHQRVSVPAVIRALIARVRQHEDDDGDEE
jgi:hypothetical protein